MLVTKNCVICGEESVRFSGHIHHEKYGKVIAGKCEIHEHDDSTTSPIKGCDTTNPYACFGIRNQMDVINTNTTI